MDFSWFRARDATRAMRACIKCRHPLCDGGKFDPGFMTRSGTMSGVRSSVRVGEETVFADVIQPIWTVSDRPDGQGNPESPGEPDSGGACQGYSVSLMRESGDQFGARKDAAVAGFPVADPFERSRADFQFRGHRNLPFSYYFYSVYSISGKGVPENKESRRMRDFKGFVELGGSTNLRPGPTPPPRTRTAAVPGWNGGGCRRREG